MIEKPKRPKQLNNQDRKIPATIQELITRYDLENKDIYEFLDYLVNSINNMPSSSSKTGDTLPIGSITQYPSNNIPENWLLCDGREISRNDYPELFIAIGTIFGTGDGSTTFNLPDLRKRVPVGKDESDTDFNILGKTGGEKTHTLTVQEMPNHVHNLKTSNQTGNHSDGFIHNGSYELSNEGMSTKDTGGGQAHNNLQPYIVQNYIIKAKQSAGIVATIVDGLNSTSATDALSAKQGKILNDKFSKHIITAKGDSGQIDVYSDGTKVPMATAVTIGNKLTLTNDGGIQIGAGVSKIAFSASTTYTSGAASQHALMIYKNSKTDGNRLGRVLFNSSFDVQATISIPYQIVSVSENDILYLFASSSVNKNVSGLLSYMTVEVVD